MFCVVAIRHSLDGGDWGINETSSDKIVQASSTEKMVSSEKPQNLRRMDFMDFTCHPWGWKIRGFSF